MSYHFEEAVIAETQTLLDASKDPAYNNVYQKMLDLLEKPMLQRIMRTTDNNQSQAALVLGISRATLRTKLKRHNLL